VVCFPSRLALAITCLCLPLPTAVASYICGSECISETLCCGNPGPAPNCPNGTVCNDATLVCDCDPVSAAPRIMRLKSPLLMRPPLPLGPFPWDQIWVRTGGAGKAQRGDSMQP
jgi:hypothetical protein